MADGYLESRYDEYERRKAAWLKKKKKIQLEASAKSFITAMAVILLMMILTYALTFIIPGGGIPFWKWVLSPVLVLFGEDNGSLIAIIA